MASGQFLRVVFVLITLLPSLQPTIMKYLKVIMKLLYWSPILGPKEKILLYIIFYALGAREQCAKLLELLWWQSCQMSDVTEVRGRCFKARSGTKLITHSHHMAACWAGIRYNCHKIRHNARLFKLSSAKTRTARFVVGESLFCPSIRPRVGAEPSETTLC